MNNYNNINNDSIAENDESLNNVSGFFTNTAKNEKLKKPNSGFMNKMFDMINNDDNNDCNNNEIDELKLPILDDLKRALSENALQQCKSEHTLRTITVMSRHNFLLRVLCFALKVLLNGNKYCMICDKMLPFAGLKPTICDDKFCQFRHDELGLGFSLAYELLNRKAITDLLISMCYAACNSGRVSIFFSNRSTWRQRW